MASSASFKRITRAILVGVVFIVAFRVGWFFYFPYTEEGKRQARVEAASLHAKKVVAPLLAKQKRFEDVQVFGSWKDEGYFGVRGGVENETDWKDLEQLIVSSHPPASIAWDLYVGERHITNIATIAP